MATSIFDGKEYPPCEFDLDRVLSTSKDTWENLFDYLKSTHEVIETEWKFYSKNTGWCLKVYNEKGKNILFLLPNDAFFIVTLNMSVKVKEEVLQSNVSNKSKKKIEDSRIYKEGISVLFAIYDTKDLEDVEIILNIRDNKLNRYESKL